MSRPFAHPHTYTQVLFKECLCSWREAWVKLWIRSILLHEELNKLNSHSSSSNIKLHLNLKLCLFLHKHSVIEASSCSALSKIISSFPVWLVQLVICGTLLWGDERSNTVTCPRRYRSACRDIRCDRWGETAKAAHHISHIVMLRGEKRGNQKKA